MILLIYWVITKQGFTTSGKLKIDNPPVISGIEIVQA